MNKGVKMDAEVKEVKMKKSSQLYDTFCRFRKHKMAWVGSCIISLVILVAIFGHWVAPHDPYRIDMGNRFSPPSLENPFGTDRLGRDLLSRIIYGARIAILIGVIVVMIQAGIGIFIGILSGYYGGIIDELFMRLTDVVWAFPPMVLALAFVIVFGPGIFNVVIAIAIVSWAPFARVTRSEIQSLKQREFIEGARAIGESNFNIIVRYILPNIIAPNIVLVTLTMPGALLTASAMSFLGFGAQPPMPEWGAILAGGRGYLRIAPWIATFPGLAILFTVLGFNFLGDGLRDALDPKLRGTR
jgi:ABC-type dipeptide/oligopeptide/nickel transport system permease subunit